MFHSADKINFSYRDSYENNFNVDFVAVKQDKLKVVKNLGYDKVFRPSICTSEQLRQRLNILRSFIFGEKISDEKIPMQNVFRIDIREKLFSYSVNLVRCKLSDKVVSGTVYYEKLLYNQKLLLYSNVNSECSLLTDFSDYKLENDVLELFSILFQFINFNFSIGENR